MIAAFAFVATRLFAGGYWINLSQPALASSLALFGGVGYQYFVEGREKRKMKRLFGQYVSKDVYEQLVANPELARLGGQRREMTVLFSDIRGFTTVSEKGEPEEIVGMLNEYFTRMVDIVFTHKGTLDKFVGDMVMALFGAPLDDPQHAEHAVDAALEMIRELEPSERKVDGGRAAGARHRHRHQHGADDCRQYRVGGDHELYGHRRRRKPRRPAGIAEQAVRNSDYHQRGHTRGALPDRYVFRPLGDVVVKGKTRPVAIFEVKENHGMKHHSASPSVAGLIVIAILAVSSPAYAQLGGIMRKAQKAQERKQQFDDLNITETEEIQLGADVSAKIRQRFGVVQDPAVHKYVALVGTVLTEQTTRPKLPWTFIVLDTDGVNAFAAPGGFVHITRGALGAHQDRSGAGRRAGARDRARRAEAHGQCHSAKAKACRSARARRCPIAGRSSTSLANSAYEMVLENSFDRGDELDADKEGLVLVQKVGYAAAGSPTS